MALDFLAGCLGGESINSIAKVKVRPESESQFPYFMNIENNFPALITADEG